MTLHDAHQARLASELDALGAAYGSRFLTEASPDNALPADALALTDAQGHTHYVLARVLGDAAQAGQRIHTTPCDVHEIIVILVWLIRGPSPVTAWVPPACPAAARTAAGR